MNYRQAIAELEALPMMPDRAPSLEPTLRALERLDISFSDSRVVIVAGTNGKGSVCACLEALLLSAGQTTGLYTSPHLVETTERFRRNGKDISEQEFVQAYEAVCSRTRGIRLTHFEILTLMAYWTLASGVSAPPVDWLILEVGLGGTWDATNAVPHRICVITSLGLDHQNLLGDSLTEIAGNKFGVIPKVHPPAVVVHTEFQDEAVRTLSRKVGAKTNAKFIPATEWTCDVKQETDGPRFCLSTKWGSVELGLPGARGAQNAATALTAFAALGFNPRDGIQSLSTVRWPGRMERIELARSPCPVYLSGDHNPQGILSLIEILNHYPRRTLHLLVGIGKDKDCDSILTSLRSLPDTRIYLTTTPYRGRVLSEYGRWLSVADGSFEDPVRGLRRVIEMASAGDLIVVTGSLYLVGAIHSKTTV